MAVFMRSILEVADNSGARKLQMILPIGGSTGLRARIGDVVTAAVKEASPGRHGEKGNGGQVRDRADPQGNAAPRRLLYSL